jgi:hypothetical protein
MLPKLIPMRYLFIFLILNIYFKAFPQLYFDFETNGLEEWTQSISGRWDTSSYMPIDGKYSLHHIFDNPSSGHDQISHSIQNLVFTDTITWQFRVRHNYSPSSANNWSFFLVSDKSATDMYPSCTVNGYAVGVNYTGLDDCLKLWKIQSGAAIELINSKLNWDTLAGTTGTPAIRIVRIPDGTWQLFVSASGNNNDFISSGSASDIEYTKAFYFGIYYKYSSSQDRKLWFDDIIINGKFVTDTLPPAIDTFLVKSSHEILIRFSEPIDSSNIPTSVFNAGNSLGLADSIVFQSDDEILLHFNGEFPNGTSFKLTVSDIRDKAGNLMKDTGLIITYYTPKLFDVQVSEIMANPDPPVGLPDYEYLELYNRSDFNLNLENWLLEIGNTKKSFPSIIIPAKGFLVVCSPDAKKDFEDFGKTIDLLSNGYALNNSGQSIVLRDSNNRLISFVTYSDDWYQDEYKKGGGWSLEMIDPLNPCGEADNWKASVDKSGGTPGRTNSVNAENPDNIRPELLKLYVPSDSFLILMFSEPYDSTDVFSTSLYTVNGSMGHPLKILSYGNNYMGLLLFFSNHFLDNKIYTLTVSHTFSDCAGNEAGSDQAIDFSLPLAADSFDVIINEVLFNAYPYGSEFVELYNRSDKVVNAGLLVIAVSDSMNGKVASFTPFEENGALFFPGTYLVITQNIENVRKFYYTPSIKNFVEQKNLPSLADKQGTIILMNKQEKTLDKFSYSEDMQFPLLASKEGVSLERISFSQPTNSPSNWHSAAQSADFATPGYRNSQASEDKPTENKIQIKPEVFSPNNDGIDDFLKITYQSDKPGNMANITIYDSKGRIVRRLVRNSLLGLSDTFTWDGCDDNRSLSNTGIYIIHLSIFNLNGKTEEYKKVCVLSR